MVYIKKNNIFYMYLYEVTDCVGTFIKKKKTEYYVFVAMHHIILCAIVCAFDAKKA